MEQLWVPSLPILGGRMLPLLRHCCAFGTHHPLSWGSIFQTLGREQKQIRSWSAQCSSNYEGASVPDKDNPLKNLTIPVNSLLDACILYCTSPALGHNKEAHPESNKRVPAIVDALEKLELSPKHRGSQVLEIQNFNPASLDDVARVHSKSYITGLEKAMSRAANEGLIFIEGTGPTYATETTFQESLLSAGAGITLVDSVVARIRNTARPMTTEELIAAGLPLDQAAEDAGSPSGSRSREDGEAGSDGGEDVGDVDAGVDDLVMLRTSGPLPPSLAFGESKVTSNLVREYEKATPRMD